MGDLKRHIGGGGPTNEAASVALCKIPVNLLIHGFTGYCFSLQMIQIPYCFLISVNDPLDVVAHILLTCYLCINYVQLYISSYIYILSCIIIFPYLFIFPLYFVTMHSYSE